MTSSGMLLFGTIALAVGAPMWMYGVRWRRWTRAALAHMRHFAAIAPGPVTLIGFWRLAGGRFLVEESVTGERALVDTGANTSAADDGEHVIVIGRAVDRVSDRALVNYRERAQPPWRIDVSGREDCVLPDPDRLARRARDAETLEPAGLVAVMFGASFLLVGWLARSVGL
ncbi:MAG TPA: hypothetical protein VFF06_21220 [Polyangia bacterium]|nr:hypothetical protein [Polyangia bacterium]